MFGERSADEKKFKEYLSECCQKLVDVNHLGALSRKQLPAYNLTAINMQDSYPQAPCVFDHPAYVKEVRTKHGGIRAAAIFPLTNKGCWIQLWPETGEGCMVKIPYLTALFVHADYVHSGFFRDDPAHGNPSCVLDIFVNCARKPSQDVPVEESAYIHDRSVIALRQGVKPHS